MRAREPSLLVAGQEAPASCRGRRTAERQAEGLTVGSFRAAGMSQCSTKVNLLFCYVKVKALNGKIWDPKTWDEDIWVDASEDVGSTDLPEPLKLASQGSPLFTERPSTSHV